MAIKAGSIHPGSSDRRWDIPICIVLAVITLAVFWQTVQYEFVNSDDNIYIYENPFVQRGLTWAGLHWAFTYGEIGHWHPLTWLSHMLDCQMYGLDAGGHHLTNVLLHTTSVILLFLVLRQMTGMVWRSAFVAAIFAVHPLRAESVAWISERKDVLSGLFFMLTLLMYFRYVHSPRSILRYSAVLIAFTLGLLSKNMLVTLPFVLLLLDFWPLKRFSDFAPEVVFRLTVEKVPLFLLTVASCVMTALVPEKVDTDIHLPFVLRMENAIVSYITYLWQMIYPSGLACLYPNPTSHLPVWQVVGAMGLLLGISAVVLFVHKSYPWLMVGWLWYLGMLIPVIGIVQISYYAHADRYTYLPQIGIYIAITWAAAELAEKWQVRHIVLGNMMSGVIVLLMACAWKQTTYWKNSEMLWRHTLAVTSNNSIAHNNLGTALAKNGHLDEAISEFQKALMINSNNPEIYYNLGIAFAQKGQLDQAALEYQNAVAINPNYMAAYCDLGNALLQKGHADEAVQEFQKALAINPGYALAHYDLGNVLAQKGQINEAIQEFQKAVAINPNYSQAHNNLGNLLLQKGQVDDAIREYKKTLAFSPNDAETYYNLGVALAQNGQEDEAFLEYQKALAINPHYAMAYCNLGNLLLRKGRVDDAIGQFQKALIVQPGFVAAYDSLQHIAWVMATSPDSHLRNGTKAVDLAQQEDRLTGNNNLMALATLAAAYAEIGEFVEAIANAQHALQLASSQNDPAMIFALQAQLKCYQAGSPFRDSGSLP